MSNRVLTEFHAHTKEVSQCSELSAKEIVETLHRLSYGALVTTDHYVPGERNSRALREDFLGGYRAAKEAAEPLGMVVLPGLEIRFKDRLEDFLVYGLDEEDILSLPDDACEKGLYEFHLMTKEKGGLIYQAHPFRPKMLPAHPRDIDGMETFNGNPRQNSQNRLAAAFATRHSLRTIAGSDVHQTGDAGIVGVMVPEEALTPQEFAKWLQRTPHPRVQHQEPPHDGIRYLAGAIPHWRMLETLYKDVGWSRYVEDMSAAMQGVERSLRVVTAWDDTALIGMGRVIGDEHTILYVQDILVLGTYQRRGIGQGILRRLLAPYPHARQIVLITDDNPVTRGFYRACGFDNIAELGCVGYVRLA